MSRQNVITGIELLPANVAGAEPAWIRARWTRADRSEGRAFARFERPKKGYRIAELLLQWPTLELLRDVPLRRIESAANADDAIRHYLGLRGPFEERLRKTKLNERRRRARLTLKPPSTRQLDSDYLVHVADCYTDAVAYGLQPADTMHKDSGIPLGTINRWIAEAKDDDEAAGHFPPDDEGG